MDARVFGERRWAIERLGASFFLVSPSFDVHGPAHGDWCSEVASNLALFMFSACTLHPPHETGDTLAAPSVSRGDYPTLL
eukprot:6182280-Pleurochrysis_carterae.AAC.4